MPQDKYDLSDFDELFIGNEFTPTVHSIVSTWFGAKDIEINRYYVKYYIQTKLSTEIKKAKIEVLEEAMFKIIDEEPTNDIEFNRWWKDKEIIQKLIDKLN